MDREQINKIHSDYLNDCETEHDMDQIFDLALQSQAETKCNPNDCPHPYGTYETCNECKANRDNVFKMRDATPEEQEAIDKYIKSISKPTGVDFDSLSDSQIIHHLTDNAYSELCLLAAKGREALQAQADGEYVRKKDVIGCIGQTSLHFELARKLRKLPTVSIPSAEPKDSEDKIIRRTLENFMRGLWEEIQVGELEYTTSEVYEMLEREIFTDNHVTIPSAEPTYYPPCEDCHKKMDEIRNAYDKMMDEIRKTHDKMLSLDDDCISRSKTVADIKEFFRMGDCYCDEYSIVGCINGQPSVAIRR